MFFYFESNFIEKFLWKSGFSNFGHATLSKIRFFGRYFETEYFLMFFMLIYEILILFYILHDCLSEVSD